MPQEGKRSRKPERTKKDLEATRAANRDWVLERYDTHGENAQAILTTAKRENVKISIRTIQGILKKKNEGRRGNPPAAGNPGEREPVAKNADPADYDTFGDAHTMPADDE